MKNLKTLGKKGLATVMSALVLTAGITALPVVSDMTSITVNAADFTQDGLEYYNNGDGTVTITGFIYDTTKLTIPSKTDDGKTVTRIGGEAFRDKTNLTSILIPSTVTEIGDYAFYGCSSLTSITIPSSVKSIGINAFAECTSLKKVTIPNGVKSIEDEAFYGCTSLKNVTIPSSVTQIGNYAFGFEYISELLGYYEKIPNFTIYGKKGSKAQIYANNAGLTFKEMLVNNSSISATSITKGSSITLTAKATGGTAPYKYRYFCKPQGDSSWTALTSTTTATSYKHTPARAIKYEYAVKVADSTGNVITKYFTVNVSSSSALANASTISATSITKGSSIKLTAKATGGTAPYKYRYFCKPTGSTRYTALTSTTTSTTCTHKPAKSGTYSYAVKVADSTGKVITKYFTVKVK